MLLVEPYSFSPPAYPPSLSLSPSLSLPLSNFLPHLRAHTHSHTYKPTVSQFLFPSPSLSFSISHRFLVYILAAPSPLLSPLCQSFPLHLPLLSLTISPTLPLLSPSLSLSLLRSRHQKAGWRRLNIVCDITRMSDPQRRPLGENAQAILDFERMSWGVLA